MNRYLYFVGILFCKYMWIGINFLVGIYWKSRCYENFFMFFVIVICVLLGYMYVGCVNYLKLIVFFFYIL